MKHIYKEYWPPFWTGCNRFLSVWFGAVFIGFYRSGLVWFLSVFLSQKVELQPVQFSPVWFRFISGSLNWTFKHYREVFFAFKKESMKRLKFREGEEIWWTWCLQWWSVEWVSIISSQLWAWASVAVAWLNSYWLGFDHFGIFVVPKLS